MQFSMYNPMTKHWKQNNRRQLINSGLQLKLNDSKRFSLQCPRPGIEDVYMTYCLSSKSLERR